MKSLLARKRAYALIAGVSLAMSGLVAAGTPAAATTTVNTTELTINGAGGANAGDTDGIGIHINGQNLTGPDTYAANGTDEIYLGGLNQWCCSGGGPMLWIGDTLYGEIYNGNHTSWDSVTYSNLLGSAKDDGSTASGSGSADITYTATHNSKVYTIVRHVAYTYPDHFYRNTFTFTLPSGTSDPVKFYDGGDTAPGGSDWGFGVKLDTPTYAHKAVLSVNPNFNPGMYIGFQEVTGSAGFDGYVSQYYDDAVSVINVGGDLGTYLQTEGHDAGIMIQWNLGSTPGTYTRSMDSLVGRYTSITMNSDNNLTSLSRGSNTNMVFDINNSDKASKSNLTFTVNLPAGFTKNGTVTSDCPTAGTSSVPSAGHVAISGLGVAASAICHVTLPVHVNATGDTEMTVANVTEGFPLFNMVKFTYDVSDLTTRIVKPSTGDTLATGTGGALPSPTNADETLTPGAVGPGEGVEFTSDSAHTGNLPDALYIDGQNYGSGDYDSHPVPFTYEDLIGFANDLSIDVCNNMTVTYRVYSDGNGTSDFSDTGNIVGSSEVTLLADSTHDGCVMDPNTPTETTDLALNLNLSLDMPMTDASSLLTGSGLMPGSAFQLIMQSDPVLLYSGTTDPDGNFSDIFNFAAVTCPEPGAHTLTLVGIRPDGTTAKATAKIAIDSDCLVKAIVQGGLIKQADFGGVLFHYNSTKLTKKSKQNLQFLAPLLVNTKEIALYGYTQTNLKSRASKIANKILAKRRTIAVRKYLKSLGVTGNFKLIGKGAVNPASKKHQYKNRRVTIKVKYLPPVAV